MGKWKYKYSFICGICFLISFFYKELIIFSPISDNNILITMIFLFILACVIGLFLGFLKYSLLNELIFFKATTILVLVSYPLFVIAELLDRLFAISNLSSFLIFSLNILVSASFLLWGIALLIRKKIYGKLTIIQGLFAILLALSFLIPVFIYIKFPSFLILFISLTYLVNKNSNKLVAKKKEIRLL